MAIEDLTAKIDTARLPKHIAIIMDGNGRWARKRMLPRIAGHHAGVKTVDRIVTFCRKLGIEALTLYSFSSENWRRPQTEIGALMNILREYTQKELSRMLQENIRLNVIGRLEDIPQFAAEEVRSAMMKTKNNTGMTLTLALSYGSRDEIARAIRKIARDAADGLIKPEELDEEKISFYMDTNGLPDPDLLVRTSGELRISNFLLWQIAYTELYFTEKLWPDFMEEDLAEAILSYQKRERRYGRTTEQMAGGGG